MRLNTSFNLTGRRQAGFMLLELIVACTIGSTLLGIGAGQLEKTLRRRESQAIGYQLRQITDAAKLYVRDHYASMHQTASNGFESQFTVEELQSAGYLDASVQLSNSFKQTYTIQVAATELSDQPTQLSILVLSQGGAEIPQADAQHIAGYAGGDAGYIDRRSDGSVLSGTGKTWMVNGIANATYGHVGSLNFIRENEILDAQSFLMRKKVEHHPEYNQMQTDLDMQANKIVGSSADFSYQISAASGIHLSCMTDASRTQVKFQASKLGSIKHCTEMIPDGFYVTSGSKRAQMDADRVEMSNSGRSQLSSESLVFSGNGSSERGELSAQKVELTGSGKRSTLLSSNSLIARAPAGSSGAYTYPGADEANSSRYSELNGSYIKLPVYHTVGSDGQSWWETAPRICKQVDANPKDSFGKAFIISAFYNGEQQRRLIICTPTGAMAFDGETLADRG